MSNPTHRSHSAADLLNHLTSLGEAIAFCHTTKVTAQLALAEVEAAKTLLNRMEKRFLDSPNAVTLSDVGRATLRLLDAETAVECSTKELHQAEHMLRKKRQRYAQAQQVSDVNQISTIKHETTLLIVEKSKIKGSNDPTLNGTTVTSKR